MSVEIARETWSSTDSDDIDSGDDDDDDVDDDDDDDESRKCVVHANDECRSCKCAALAL